MAIISSINDTAGKAFNYVAKSKWMTEKLNQGVSNPARFAAAMLVTSIVSKDAIGCFLYASQSLNNKKIPEEKRKFVAALDLMNGILMVGGQFLIGKIIDAKMTPWLTSKFTGTIKDKFTGKETVVNSNAIFSNDNIVNTVKKIAKTANIDLKNVKTEEVLKTITKNYRTPFEKGFGILVAAIATTALTKRTIVPLLATPMAGWFKDKFMSGNKKSQDKPKIDSAAEMEVNSALIAARWKQPETEKTKFNSFNTKA